MDGKTVLASVGLSVLTIWLLNQFDATKELLGGEGDVRVALTNTFFGNRS